MNELRDQIELVWMTGELHLEKATVEREVAWACISSTKPCSRCCRRCSTPWRRASRSIPGREVRGAGVLPVRLVDRRRPRRQSLRYLVRHTGDPAAQRARLAPALPRRRHGARPHALAYRALPAGARALQGRTGAASRRERGWPRHRQPQPWRSLSSVPHLRPAQARSHDPAQQGPASHGGRTTRAPMASSTTCVSWSRGWPTRGARRSPSISCGRCGAWWRSSASPRSASTCARTHADYEDPARPLAAGAWPEPDAPRHRFARMESVAARRVGQISHAGTQLRGPARRRPRDPGDLRVGRRDARAARPGSLRLLHPVDDPLRSGRPRRLSPRQGGRQLLDAAGTEICCLPIVPCSRPSTTCGPRPRS